MLLCHSKITLPENITLYQSKAWHTAIVNDHIDHQLVGSVSREHVCNLSSSGPQPRPNTKIGDENCTQIFRMSVVYNFCGIHPSYHSQKLYQNTKGT
jgi:hypothetical protein